MLGALRLRVETSMSRIFLFLAAVSLGPLGLAAGPANAAQVALPPFYEAVTAMKPEGRLGEVVAKEAVATAIPGAEAWRIAYVSSDLRGRKTLSTGLVIAPAGPAPAAGRPMIAWAHGTTGTAQNCGPSQVFDPAQDLNEYNLIGGTSWTDFGVPAATELIAKGYAIVATDYQGLGGGGVHQYAMAATQARDVINAVRALGSMGLSGGAKAAAVYGWSQGGGATIAAASLASYIAETGTAFDGVTFKGFVAMAPQDVAVLIPPGATQEAEAGRLMLGLGKAFGDNVFNFTHFAMTMWAMAESLPELKLTDIFTAEGAAQLDEIFSKKCMHPASDTVTFTFGENYPALINPAPGNGVAWVKALIEASVAPAAPVGPVIIYYGSKDTTVNPEMGALYQKQTCAMGANVTRVELPGAQNHFTTPPVSQPLYLPWIEDRMAGKPLANGCPAN